MQLYYSDYSKLVIAAYKRKQKDKELSPLLANPTRGGIRRECYNVYKEKLSKGEREETNVLGTFFGVPPVGKDFSTLIRKCELDKFRPLQSLMKDKIQNPVSPTVELLAWLIDFRHRPFSTGMNVILDEEELTIINREKNTRDENPLMTDEVEMEREKAEVGFNKENKPAGRNKFRLAIAALLIAIAILEGVHIIKERESLGQLDQLLLLSMNEGKKVDSSGNALSAEMKTASPIVQVYSLNKDLPEYKPYNSARTSVRCQGITQKGLQCKRRVRNNDYCWQHD